jgi:putative ABC transport system permease protein
MADLKQAVRALLKRPAFTAIAVLTLALGIGATTSVFTVIYGVLLKPLPYAEPDRLVRLTEGRPEFALNVSYPNYVDWRARNHVFEEMAVFNTIGSVVLPGEGTAAEVVPSGTTEARLFAVMGIPAAHGRLFTTAEEKPDTPVVAVITDRLWRARYGADPGVVGRAVRMDADEVTIVGVLPPDVRPFAADVWFPMRQLSPMQLDRANHPGFAVVARLRPGIDVSGAQREMASIAAALEQEYPISNRDMHVYVHPLLDSIAGGIRPTLRLLAGGVAFLLLIACANVANLLLARAVRRERETSIRSALGASAWRLFRLYLIEGLSIGVAGCAAGLLVAGWGVRALRGVPGLALPRAGDVTIEWHVLGFALLLTLATAVLFALAPSAQAARIDLMRALRQGASADAAPAGGGRLRSALVALEVTLVVVLLAGATLMQRTLANLAAVDPGFRAGGLVAVPLVQLRPRFADEAAVTAFADGLLERLRRTGGVASAALSWPFDYTGFSWSPNINLPERPFERGLEPVAQAAAVTPEYFATMGIPFVRGRNFGPAERPGGVVSVIVNQTFARRFFPGRDPLGRRVTGVRIPRMQDMPIVGVVTDTRRGGMLKGFTPEIYVSYAQFPQAGATLIVRAAADDPLRLAGEIRAEVAATDPSVAVSGVRRLDDQLAATYGDRRALSWLLGLFAALALGLTVLGIGSVVSFAVAQRTQEIGIRMALGADRRTVVRLMIAGTLTPVAVGGGAGALALVALSRVLRSYLFGVSPADPVSLGLASTVLLLAALAAAYVPARRAASIDPLAALRTS